MLRRTFLQGISLFALALATLPHPALADTGQDAQAFIQRLAQTAIDTVADRRLSDTERDDRFRRLFVSSFDIPDIGRFVLARYWRTASASQQQEFLKLFEEITVLTWAQRFKDYNGETLQTLGATKDGERGWVVDSRILRNQGQPISVQWRLRQADDGSFRILDITVDGVSMAITYRSDYSSAIQSNGGQLDSLLSAMRNKINQLHAG